ncbi:MAG: hypothetical protein WC600_17240 [Desulfobaccales bacterium]
MAGTPVQPNLETMGADPLAYKQAIEGSIMAAARIAWGFAPHEQGTPNMTVRVEPGPVWMGGVLTEKAAQNSATITAPATNPQIYRVVKDVLTGVISVVAGEEAAAPVAPGIPVGKEPVCRVLLQASTTAITNDLITDERILGGSIEPFKVNSIYTNLGTDPATELGYGTWTPILAPAITYPLAHSPDYVKSTGAETGGYYPDNCTDPALALTGPAENNQWQTAGAVTNQRLHIALPDPRLIYGLTYENGHEAGTYTDRGAKNFTLWGSSDYSAFIDLTYAVDTNWTQLTTDVSQFVQHVSSNIADPHDVIVTPTVSYKYIAIKIADNWGSGTTLGLRRVSLITGHYQWLRTA